MVSRQSVSLSSTTQHVMPPELGGEWGTECLNIRFPLPTLMCAGYSVKLLKLQSYSDRHQKWQMNSLFDCKK